MVFSHKLISCLRMMRLRLITYRAADRHVTVMQSHRICSNYVALHLSNGSASQNTKHQTQNIHNCSTKQNIHTHTHIYIEIIDFSNPTDKCNDYNCNICHFVVLGFFFAIRYCDDIFMDVVRSVFLEIYFII